MKILNEQGLTEKEFLEIYDPDKYEKPAATVDILIFTITSEEEENYRKLPRKELKILLVKRKNHPCIGQWALPGGFVEIDENLDSAAYRELKEETNVDNVYMEQLYTWGEVGRDSRMRVISSSYISLVDSSKLDIAAGDDAEAAALFVVHHKVVKEEKTITEKGYVLESTIRLMLEGKDENLEALLKITRSVEGNVTSYMREILESQGIAFDHAKIIEYGIARLRNKIEYTDIAFSLMPDYFTLTELQQVYEIILDRELLPANFRRKISDMVIETKEYRKDAGHRPSKLYRFNQHWQDKSY